MKLAAARSLDARNQSHLYAVAVRAKRRILVNQARGQQREKRMDSRRRNSLDEAQLAGLATSTSSEVLAVHDALE